MKRRARKGEPIAWLKAHRHHTGRACLIWPFSCDEAGKAQCGADKKAARVMCELAHGQPRPGQHALHRCSNGHLGCVNPEHLYWGTPRQNGRDRVLSAIARSEYVDRFIDDVYEYKMENPD